MCFALITANCFLRVTSRIEGAHAELKQHLRISTGNLLDVVESIHLLIKNKTEKIVESLVTAKQRTPFCLRKPYFEDVISLVTPTALAHIQGQVELAEASDFDICSGGFRSSMGLSCKHEIKLLLSRDNWKISLSQIDQHWWFDRIDTPPNRLIPGNQDRLLEPLVVVKRKGRPKKATQPVRSTARDLSLWELPHSTAAN